jgi:hypothetical protein
VDDHANSNASGDDYEIGFGARTTQLLEAVMLILTSTEIEASLITGAVAALAIVGSVLTTVLTIRNQRALAEEERISTRRADTYIRLLEYQRQHPTLKGLLPVEVAAPLLAYGSESVNDALSVVRKSSEEPGYDAYDKAIDSLLAQIRLELQGRADTHPLRATSRWQS